MAKPHLKAPKKHQERSVGLIIMTGIWLEPGLPDQLMAVLQRRGERNHERGFQAETWPGLCQVTTHGKLEPGESWEEALGREAAEELGQRVADWLKAYVLPVSLGVVLLNEIGDDSSPKHIRTYGTYLPVSVIRKVRLNGSTGGLQFVSRETLARIQTTSGKLFDKITGVPLREQIVMFPDELETLKAAFEKFK